VTGERQIVTPYLCCRDAVRDPFGHRWFLATPVQDVAKDELRRRVGDRFEVN